jgi:hypothetical protein
MTKLKLTINERVFRCGNNPSSINFANFLLAIGENRIDIERTVGEKSIKMPNEYVFQSQNVEDFIHWCYPDFDFGSHDNINSQTAILAPTNEDVDLLNNIALDMFPGEKKVLLSGDRIKVHYVGRLKSNNKIFDSSLKKPFVFRLFALANTHFVWYY